MWPCSCHVVWERRPSVWRSTGGIMSLLAASCLTFAQRLLFFECVRCIVYTVQCTVYDIYMHFYILHSTWMLDLLDLSLMSYIHIHIQYLLFTLYYTHTLYMYAFLFSPAYLFQHLWFEIRIHYPSNSQRIRSRFKIQAGVSSNDVWRIIRIST